MARTARASQAGFCYHVLNRGNARSEVFHKTADFSAFLQLIGEASVRLPMGLLGYCLMPNHFHLVVRPAGDGDLSRRMQWLLTTHVRRYLKHYGAHRPRLAGPLQGVSDPGGRPPGDGRALRRAEPASRPSGHPRRGLALVEPRGVGRERRHGTEARQRGASSTGRLDRVRQRGDDRGGSRVHRTIHPSQSPLRRRRVDTRQRRTSGIGIKLEVAGGTASRCQA